jgi:hypothetical protein
MLLTCCLLGGWCVGICQGHNPAAVNSHACRLTSTSCWTFSERYTWCVEDSQLEQNSPTESLPQVTVDDSLSSVEGPLEVAAPPDASSLSFISPGSPPNLPFVVNPFAIASMQPSGDQLPLPLCPCSPWYRVGREDDSILLRPLTVMKLELYMRTPWLPGLAGLEQPQAVLQVGDQTWEPFSFWLTSSMNARGRFLPFLASLSFPEDHVPLLLALTKRSYFGLLLLVSTCLSWEGRQEVLPCPSVLLLAASLSLSPSPASRRSPRRPGGRWFAPPWAAVWGVARGGWRGG